MIYHFVDVSKYYKYVTTNNGTFYYFFNYKKGKINGIILNDFATARRIFYLFILTTRYKFLLYCLSQINFLFDYEYKFCSSLL